MVWEDSPLVRAAKFGRVLVVDEADKAPLGVVGVLKTLAEGGVLELSDGRCIVGRGDHNRCAGDGGGGGVEQDGPEDVMHVAEGFRLLLLANPPGYPFQGNDLHAECADAFSTLVVQALDLG